MKKQVKGSDTFLGYGLIITVIWAIISGQIFFDGTFVTFTGMGLVIFGTLGGIRLLYNYRE